jgi:hypothetical protein
LRCLRGRGMPCDIKVHHTPAVVCEYHQHKQDPERGCRHSKAADGNHLFEMVIQEDPPGLRRCLGVLRQQSRDGPLGEVDPQPKQFTVDAWSALQRMGCGHLAD